MNQNNENETIKINDRRSFNPDGSQRAEQASDFASASSSADNRGSSQNQEELSFGASHTLPPANFANFILSLASSVQMCLGLSPNPFSGKVEKDLSQAKHSLDLMGMIQEKTKGNLTREEEQLLQVILTDLRLRYVEENKK